MIVTVKKYISVKNLHFFRSKEPETPMTPDDADGNSNREFAFVSPPAIKKIPGISAGDSTKIVFYIKSSTTGIRGININVTYKVEEDSTKFECHLEEKLNLETTEPFLIASELLRYSTQRARKFKTMQAKKLVKSNK